MMLERPYMVAGRCCDGERSIADPLSERVREISWCCRYAPGNVTEKDLMLIATLLEDYADIASFPVRQAASCLKLIRDARANGPKARPT